MKKTTYTYPAIFSYADCYEIAVYFSDLRSAACGPTYDHALHLAEKSMISAISQLKKENSPLPKPTSLDSFFPQSNERIVLVTVKV